jgi:hypothetical protein
LSECRTNERRIRSRFPNPFFLAMSSAEKRPAPIISRADSTRSRSIAFAGDCPVSSLNNRLNCRGLRKAAFAKVPTDNGVLKWAFAYARRSGRVPT